MEENIEVWRTQSNDPCSFILILTEPKREPADSKEDEDDVFGQRTSTSSTEGVPTSPPAKKPSKVMVPLPGFGGPKVSLIDTILP